MAKRGHPKTFDSAEELISLWNEFCDNIIQNNFTDVPTQSAFCRWLAKNYQATDRKTIYNSLNKYFPNIKKEFEQIQSDTIMQGGMLGCYQPTMSIFGLKNWCGWVDKLETNNTNNTTVDLSKFSTKELKGMLDEEV